VRAIAPFRGDVYRFFLFFFNELEESEKLARRLLVWGGIVFCTGICEMEDLGIKNSGYSEGLAKGPNGRDKATALAGLANSFQDFLGKAGLKLDSSLNALTDSAGISAKSRVGRLQRRSAARLWNGQPGLRRTPH